MSVVQVLNVKLQRADQSVSWGFNVQGGKEFHCPLVIQKVNPNSLAERCSIRPGDYILRIGNIVTENLSHNQGRDAIIRQGNNLELTLQRGAPPRSDDYNAKMDFPQHQLMTPENIELKSTLSPQVGIQLGSNKALLTQSYNSPMGLYSSQNIADTLVTTIKNDISNTNESEKLKMSFSSSSSTTSASVSVSPISNISSSSTFYQHNEAVLNQTINSRPYLDLNQRPKPFALRKASVETFSYKPKFQTVQLISQLEETKINKLESQKLDSEVIDINNNNNNVKNRSSPYLFRAIPFNIEQSTSPYTISTASSLNHFSDSIDHENQEELARSLSNAKVLEKKLVSNVKNDLSSNFLNNSIYSMLNISNNQEAKKNDEKQSDLKISKELKESLKKELMLRLNPSLKQNKETSIINGRLLLKSINNLDNIKDENSSPLNEGYLIRNRFKSSDNIMNEIDKTRNSKFIDYNTDNGNFAYSKRNNSVANINFSDRLTKESKLKSSYKQPSLIDSASPLSSSVTSSPRRNISKLDDPNKPSVTQSRTFKLLQETLDNGLSVNDVVIHDKLTNKNQVRRCSLTPNENVSNRNNLNKNNSKFLNNTRSNSLFPTFGSVASQQLYMLRQEKKLNTINSNEKKEVESSTPSNNDNILIDEINEKRKKYIRSLSLANDDTAEPLFLKEFAKKLSKQNASKDNRNTIIEIED